MRLLLDAGNLHDRYLASQRLWDHSLICKAINVILSTSPSSLGLSQLKGHLSEWVSEGVGNFQSCDAYKTIWHWIVYTKIIHNAKKPTLPMTTIAFARFAPALQPTHAKELILMLQEIEAVGVTRLRKTSRPGRSWAWDILYCDRREEAWKSIQVLRLEHGSGTFRPLWELWKNKPTDQPPDDAQTWG